MSNPTPPPDTVKLDIRTPIEAAAKRALTAIDSGYLTDQMARDLDTLMRAAMCWEMYNKKT